MFLQCISVFVEPCWCFSTLLEYFELYAIIYKVDLKYLVCHLKQENKCNGTYQLDMGILSIYS